MRKIDLVLLLVVIGVGASLWHPAPKAPPPLAAPTAVANATGELRLAGLRMDSTTAEVERVLGAPTEKKGNASWVYRSDGAELFLLFIDDHLASAQGRGRWMLDRGGQTLPCFLAARAQIEGAFGAPTTQNASAYTYRWPDRELLFHFDNDKVTELVLTRSYKALPETMGGKK